ncbi:hydrolase [Aerococcus phage vB_AviM_AVP]|nr:hydrolase [Aerococcus phage vB_AviM_AVP]
MKQYQVEIFKANRGQLLIDTKAYYSYYSDFENLEKLVEEFANIKLNLQGLPLYEVEEILMDFDLYYGTANVLGGHNFNYLTYNTTEDITRALEIIHSADIKTF